MDTKTLISISGTALYAAFLLYLAATFFFGAAIRDKGRKNKQGITGKIGITITLLGFAAHLVYFVTRWIASGHAPLGNMFEFVTFFGMTMVLGFLIIWFIYRINVMGLLALPVAMIVIAYASVFPREIAPLGPSLQSNWLPIHVSTVSLGNGILSISFVAGLIYLIRQIDQSKRSRQTVWLEIVLLSLYMFVGFSVISGIFNGAGYKADFEYMQDNKTLTTEYRMPAIAGPYEGKLLTKEKLQPWIETPSWFHGKDSGRKFNTVIWSAATGAAMYVLTRLIARRRVGALLQPLMKRTKPELLDEVSYRAVAIGFPVFTLGGLIFASIWAQIAWDRFWGWDPKEVWALVTWFFYAAFLHLRLSRGWHGERSAWLAVVGFAIIMFNLVAVNLILAGLHSYA